MRKNKDFVWDSLIRKDVFSMAINSLSGSSHGLSGLVSGMNSQEMVEKLLSGTQAKIDKTSQKKTTLQYKQGMYRDAASKLRALQSGFLSFTNPKTNLLSNAFYNSMSASITPPKGKSAAFSVSATSSAKAGTATVDYVEKLAKAYSWKTTSPASGKVEGMISKADAEKLLGKFTGPDARLEIKVGDGSITFDNATQKFGGKSSSQVAQMINDEFKATDIKAQARFENNKLVIQADDSNAYIEIFSNKSPIAVNKTLGMQMFGNISSLSGKGAVTSSIDTDRYLPGFKVNLDGRDQMINIDLNLLEAYKTSGDPSDLLADINSKLTRAFGSGVKLDSTTVDGKTTIEFKPGSTSQQFTITGSAEMMNTLGIKSGISNKLNPGMAIKDLNFQGEILGDTQTFKINGVEFSFSSGTALSTIMNTVNNSKAGVKMTYNQSQDMFMLENAESGAGNDNIKVTQSEGNLFSVLFGVQGGGSVKGPALSKGIYGNALWTTDEEKTDFIDTIKYGGKFTFNVDGKDVTFTVPKKANDGVYTLDEFAKNLNDAFSAQFGKTEDGKQALEIKLEVDRFDITANNKNLNVKIKPQNNDTNKSLLGFTEGDSTRVTDENATLVGSGIFFGAGSTIDFKVGADTLTMDASTLDGKSLTQVASDIETYVKNAVKAQKMADGLTGAELQNAVDAVSVAFDKQTSGFKIVGVSVPMEITIKDGGNGSNLDGLFGNTSLTLNQAAVAGKYKDDLGQNAVVSINGNRIERNNNSFVYDGLSFTLHDTTQMFDEDGKPIKVDGKEVYDKGGSITVTRDTEQILEGLQEFLKLYNETIDYLNEIYKADPTYKKYPPLSQKQQESMSDREVELWEKKAKEGLLRGDENLEKILRTMRGALYGKPDGSQISIYDLGISTSFYYNDGNFKAEDPSKLKAAIEKDPDAVRKLMAGEGGLMEVLNKAIDDATRISFAKPGSLVAVAGSNISESDSSIYKQIKDIDKQMTSLERRYWGEYDRYWKQFNTMEKLIQQMNVQSSWLSQQLSGM